MKADALLWVLHHRIHLLILLSPFKSFRLCHSWPTTLTMSFSLLPFTYTQATVIVSRFDSGFDCASPPPPGKPPWKPNKETMGLLSRQMNGCTLGKYFSEMEQEQERGRISCCQLKSKHPTSCQWASVSNVEVYRCFTICAGSRNIQDCMGEVKGSSYSPWGRKKNLPSSVSLDGKGLVLFLWRIY